MNVLYFSPIRLLPKGHGNIATVHQHILRLHALGHKVHYVYLNEDCSSVENLFCSQLFVDTFDVIENKANPQRDSQGYYCYDTKYFDGLEKRFANYVSSIVLMLLSVRMYFIPKYLNSFQRIYLKS